ncbi:MAG: DUF2066 domain-containing protein [Rickettsiales bacterium]
MAGLLLVVTLLNTSPATAGTQEIRVVGVGVDNSSLKAEARALEYARKRAVFLATRKLGVQNPAKVVAKFTDQQYGQIIRGSNVVQQRRVGDTTYSEVNITIVDEALRRNLKLPLYDELTPSTMVRGILLLTVYVGKERAYMWEKENALRAPMSDEIRRQSRGGVLLPGGDLDDLRLIDYQNALTVKSDELKPMFERYGAEEIVIAILTPGTMGTMESSSVLLRRLKPEREHNEVMDIPPSVPEETSDTRLAKSATAIASAVTQIATSTAEREQAIRSKSKKITVRFAYATPKDLAFMEEAVRASPEVFSLDLPSIALAQVGGTIYLQGDDEALRQSLTKKGVVVTSINEGWRLSVR